MRLHGARLARDERLVDGRRAVRHLAVGGHLLPRLHHDGLAHLHLVERHVGEGAVRLLHVRLRRQQFGHLLERVPCAHDGSHLDPMAQQHDDDERGQLPEEVHAHVVRVQDGSHDERVHAVDVGRGDAERHERHHGGLAVAHLVRRAAQKRPAAVDEQHRGQRGHEPVRAGKRQRDGQREPHRRRQQQDGNRQHEAHEEPPLEVHSVHHHAAGGGSSSSVRGLAHRLHLASVTHTTLSVPGFAAAAGRRLIRYGTEGAWKPRSSKQGGNAAACKLREDPPPILPPGQFPA